MRNVDRVSTPSPLSVWDNTDVFREVVWVGSGISGALIFFWIWGKFAYSNSKSLCHSLGSPELPYPP